MQPCDPLDPSPLLGDPLDCTPPPPCVGPDHCYTKYSFKSDNASIALTRVSVANECPRHSLDWSDVVNGAWLYEHEGEPFVRTIITEMALQHEEWRIAVRASRGRPDGTMFFTQGNALGALYMEYKSAKSAAETPGQQGLTPP